MTLLRPAGPVVDPVPCSGCGRPVDPLRTRHAAIFDQRLHYFCDRGCRAPFLGEGPAPRDAAAQPTTEAELAARRANFEEPIVEAFLPAPEGDALPEASLTREPRALVEPLPKVAAPADERALPVRELAEAEPRDIGGLLLVLALVSGLLAVVLGLADASRLVLAARVVLAGVGASMLLGRSASVPRDPSDLHPALGLVAPGAALVVAGAALFGADRGLAAEAAALAGVLVAASAVRTWLVELAREATLAERDMIERELSAPAWRVVGSGELEQTFDLRPGEVFVLEPGDVVAVDATLEEGELDVLPWLGATTPERKRAGDTLVAGALCLGEPGRPPVRARCVFAGADRAFVRASVDPRRRADLLVPAARSARVLSERWAVVLGVVAAALAWIIRRSPLDVALAAVAVHGAMASPLLAALPGVHVARGVLFGLRRGIVFRSADAWERAGLVQAGVFCARGTLLLGEPELAEVEPLDVHSARAVGGGLVRLEPGELLALAAGALKVDPEPLAVAAVRACVARGGRPDVARNAVRIPGLGVKALTQAGEELLVGSRPLLLKHGVSIASAEPRLLELETLGRTLLLVSVAGKLVGLLGFQDGIRPGARAAVQHLVDAGVEPVLLSGDSRETCEAIARALDLEHVRAEVPPGERGAEVKRIADIGLSVSVIGRSGVDDEPLRAASVSVALGAAGSERSEEDIVLASEDVRDAALSLAVAIRTRAEARTGFALALAPAVLGSLIAAVGLLPTVFAPLAALVGSALATVHVRNVERRG